MYMPFPPFENFINKRIKLYKFDKAAWIGGWDRLEACQSKARVYQLLLAQIKQKNKRNQVNLDETSNLHATQEISNLKSKKVRREKNVKR